VKWGTWLLWDPRSQRRDLGQPHFVGGLGIIDPVFVGLEKVLEKLAEEGHYYVVDYEGRAVSEDEHI
jgi:hypothetical protein